MAITVRRGDLLNESGQLVVGFADTFDTDTTKSRIINAMSLQGQLLARRFGGDRSALDTRLDAALAGIQASGSTSSSKPGKQTRYPNGTVAVFEDPQGDRVYGLAYTELGDNLVAHGTVDKLWDALGSLWDSVYINGQREPISLPLMGTKLARIQCMDRESLLRMILLSFVARSKEALICHELNLVVHSDDWEKLNLLEVEAFLNSLR